MSAPARLCVTVSGTTTAEVRERRELADHADLVEMRLDGLVDPDPDAAVSGSRVPVIVTCRPTWAGGAYDGSEEERQRFLARALAAGARYVDVEWGADVANPFLLGHPDAVVLSHHDFDGVPANLAGLCREMRVRGPAVVKLAVTPSTVGDLRPLIELGKQGEDGRQVLIGMGAAGLPSRVLAARFGSAWTYAGDRQEAGQISAARMVDEFRFKTVTDDTDVYGVTGAPLDHSLSPAMHNAAFAHAGIDAAYVPCIASTAEQFFDFAGAIGLRGASVTAPLKQGVAECARAVDEETAATRAANTLRRVGKEWEARNADVAGFLEPLAGKLHRGLRAAVLGCGGAARAAAYGLQRHGVTVTLYGRRIDAATTVAQELGLAGAAPLPPPAGSWDLLVNATPVGTWPRVDETPLTREWLTGRIVYDLVYNPPVTRLLHEARLAGCMTMNGLEMLIAQAQAQFEWWTGARPPGHVFRNAALEGLVRLQRVEAAGAGARSMRDEVEPR